MPPVDVLRTYLELTSPTQLVACERRGHGWLDRLAWSDEQLRQRLAQPGVSLHLLTVAAAPAGYFELERHADDSAEIAYMGLLAEFRGRGLGAFLLCEAVREAWGRGASRVWLHTCTLDSPGALPNYLARGFRPFKEEHYLAQMQAPSLG